MDTVDIVKLVSTGDITSFQNAVTDAVLDKLADKIDEYRLEIASTYSDAPDHNPTGIDQ